VDLIQSSERICIFHTDAKRCSTCRASKKERFLKGFYKVTNGVKRIQSNGMMTPFIRQKIQQLKT